MGKNYWANLTLCIVLGGLFVFAVTSISSALTPKGLFVKEPKPSAEAAALMGKVQLVNYSLAEEPNRMVRADFFLKNSSDQDVKNLNILCDFYDTQGKFLDRKTWLVSTKLPAGQTLEHRSVSERFVHTRAQGLQCSLADFAIAEAPSYVLHRIEGGHHGAASADAGHGGHGAPAGH